jgi:GTP pyrophosphokinase
MNVNMRAINFNTDGGTFSGKIKVVVKNNDTLKKLIGNLKHINGIEKVSRL